MTSSILTPVPNPSPNPIPNPTELELIRNLAFIGHLGETRKDRITPYFQHLEDLVVCSFKNGGGDDEAMLGYTHDLFENNPRHVETLKALIRKILPKDRANTLIRRIDTISHSPDVDYLTYIQQIALDPICTFIKVLDIRQNRAGSPSKAKALLYEQGLAILEPLLAKPVID